MIFTALAILLCLISISGLYFIADFFRVFLGWKQARGEITDFTKIRFMGRRVKLPTVLFVDEVGREHEAQALQIDQLLYLLNPKQKRDVIDVIYNPVNPSELRVFGYLRLMLAFFITVPSLGAAMWFLGTALLASKFAYIIIFALILVSGLALLKMIQRYY